MRLISLIVVVAIIYMVVSRMNSTHSNDVAEAVASVEAPAKPAAGNAAAPAQPARSNYGRAMDRARGVVDMANKRNQ